MLSLTRRSVATCLALLLLPVFISAQTKRNRVLEKAFQPEEPVEIVETQIGVPSSGRRAIKFNEKMLAGNDWLKGLTVTVRNNSTKRIIYLSVELDVLKNDQSPDTVSIELIYGRIPGLPDQPDPLPAVNPVAVGEDIKLTLSDEHYDVFKNLLKRVRGTSSFEKLTVRVGTIVFEDETMWRNGQFLRRDSADPLRWDPIRPGTRTSRASPPTRDVSRPWKLTAISFDKSLPHPSGFLNFYPTLFPRTQQRADCRKDVGSYNLTCNLNHPYGYGAC